MSHCCGSNEEPRKEKEEVKPSKVEEKDSKESLFKKLLKSLGLGSKDK